MYYQSSDYTLHERCCPHLLVLVFQKSSLSANVKAAKLLKYSCSETEERTNCVLAVLNMS